MRCALPFTKYVAQNVTVNDVPPTIVAALIETIFDYKCWGKNAEYESVFMSDYTLCVRLDAAIPKQYLERFRAAVGDLLQCKAGDFGGFCYTPTPRLKTILTAFNFKNRFGDMTETARTEFFGTFTDHEKQAFSAFSQFGAAAAWQVTEAQQLGRVAKNVKTELMKKEIEIAQTVCVETDILTAAQLDAAHETVNDANEKEVFAQQLTPTEHATAHVALKLVRSHYVAIGAKRDPLRAFHWKRNPSAAFENECLWEGGETFYKYFDGDFSLDNAENALQRLTQTDGGRDLLLRCARVNKGGEGAKDLENKVRKFTLQFATNAGYIAQRGKVTAFAGYLNAFAKFLRTERGTDGKAELQRYNEARGEGNCILDTDIETANVSGDGTLMNAIRKYNERQPNSLFAKAVVDSPEKRGELIDTLCENVLRIGETLRKTDKKHWIFYKKKSTFFELLDAMMNDQKWRGFTASRFKNCLSANGTGIAKGATQVEAIKIIMKTF